jgi:phosphoglycolate phosphatase-like HAD superfamily hydrolase
VYVGDQETDRQSATHAGMRFIAIGDSVADPEYHVRELHELEPMLSGW